MCENEDFNNLSQKKVLIADDEVLIRELIALDFKELDMEVLEASGGDEAYEMALKETPDIIVSDVKMPEGSGLELLEKLHALNFEGKVVMISGFSELTKERAKDLGALDLLVKPFRSVELLTILSNAFK